RIPKRARALVAKQHIALVRKIGHYNVGQAIVVVVVEIDAHASESLAVLVVADAGTQSEFGERAITIIVIQKALHGIVRNKNIRPPIPIVVGEGNPQSLAMRVGKSRLLRDVGKRAIPIVVVQDVAQAVVVVWMTVGANAVRRPFSAVPVVLKCPINVSGDEQIELPIIVIVEEPCARAPATTSDSGSFGDIGEGSIAIVVVKDIATVSGHV